MAVRTLYGPSFGCRGYTTFPGEYGFHTSVYVVPKTIGVVLERRGEFYKILFDSREVWIDEGSVTEPEGP